jgi:hypothetical protein
VQHRIRIRADAREHELDGVVARIAGIENRRLLVSMASARASALCAVQRLVIAMMMMRCSVPMCGRAMMMIRVIVSHVHVHMEHRRRPRDRQ